MTRRVVVAGLGDTGVLTAVRLSRNTDVVGISSKPGLVSGQELGRRLARPREWQRDYRIAFDRFRDAVVWAVGKVRPNTGWLPDELLDGSEPRRSPGHAQRPGPSRGGTAAFLPAAPAALGVGARRPARRAAGLRPTGRAVRFPARFVDTVLMPVITHGLIYRGVRRRC